MYLPATQTLPNVTGRDHRVASIALLLNQGLSPQYFSQLTHVLATAAVLISQSNYKLRLIS